MSISWWFNMVFNTIQHDSAWLMLIQHDSTLLQCGAPKIAKLVYNSNFTMVCGAYNYSIHGVYKHDQTILARVLFRGLAGAGDCYSQARLHWCCCRGTRPALSCAQRECRGDITGDGGEVTRQNFGMELTEHDFELLPNNFYEIYGAHFMGRGI